MDKSDEANSTFFLFINSGSGGNLGKQMIDDEVNGRLFRWKSMNSDCLS